MKRPLILAVVAAAAAVLVASMTPAGAEPSPRFATDDMLYAVDGWRVGPPDIGGRPAVAFVSRDYRSAAGTQAQLSITTSPFAKSVYRAGADVPFLGSGYAVTPAAVDLVPVDANRQALIAQRGNESWLQLAAYGERRGVVGNGIAGWSFALFDLGFGRPNDYYLMRIVMPYDDANVRSGVQLADTLFPRLAAYYARA
jgi:hypothetical protein